MRHGSAGRRSRNRGNGGGGGHRSGGGGNNRSQVFDSNGPDVRIRGTAHQVCEKYLTLAKDASSMGDRILAESYLQHAEHYQRTLNAMQPAPMEYRDNGVRRDETMSSGTSDGQGREESGRSELDLPLSVVGIQPSVEKTVSHMEDA